jgi:DNA-binding winged helix-turn-helix (wHTH) protein
MARHLMTTPVRPDRLLRFGEFELDPDAGELRRNGTRVSLPEQPFRLLTVLLERPGTIATRDELRARLWGADTFVDFEHGLNAAVKRLRDALGDSAEQPRYIETVPKRGYKFIATLDGRVTSPTEPEAAPARSGQRRLWLGFGLAIAVVVVGLVSAAFWQVRRAQSVSLVSSAARNERRLTRGDGLQTNPAWSPDGRMIAYASAAAGTWDIWIQAVAGGPARQVTKLPGAELNPSWYPDGSTILFEAVDPEGISRTRRRAHSSEHIRGEAAMVARWPPDSIRRERKSRKRRAPTPLCGGDGWSTTETCARARDVESG